MKKVLTLFVLCMLCILVLAACSHTHVWLEATCATPVFCEICGETQGTTLAHTWVNATCTTPKTCSVCGLTEGDPIDHNWTEADCFTPKTCMQCATTDGEALGHEVAEWLTTTEATCTETGLAQGNCVRCQAALEIDVEKIEHTPGEWEIITQATISEKGQRVKKCTVCQETTHTEEFELSAEEYESIYKESCKKYKFEEIARNPGQYEGELATFTGEVIQVQQESLLGYIFYVLRVNVTKKGNYYTYYTDTIYVTYTATEDDPRILEEDIITMYGELKGEKTYTTVMGASVTIPAFDAEYIDIK